MMSVVGGKMKNDTMPEICLCCMEKHEPKIIVVRENNIFKGVEVEYDAEYSIVIGQMRPTPMRGR